ncbi:MAG TPA: hypothetical protein PLX23_05615 [Candidatus Hydrogenedens sp.]|nr:hypothetical protein [Candidatus Hydrogenedens sp.]
MVKRRTRKSVRKHAKEFEEDFVISTIPESLQSIKSEKAEREYDVLTSPHGDLLLQFKKDHYRFFIVILFSLILHLSAVTIFKIVVYVPRPDFQYLDIRVVQADLQENASTSGESRLRLSKNVEPDKNDFDIDTLKQSSNFELPKIEFEELEKLKLRRTLVEDDVAAKPLVEEYKDSWAQFGVGINKIRESLIALNPFSLETELEEKEPSQSSISISPLIKQKLGSGSEIMYRWITPPYDRTLLFVPGLLEISKKDLSTEEKDYDFMLTVLPNGTISRVIDLNIIEDEVSKYIKEEVAKIHFEPLISDGSGEQQVTIRYHISGTLL